MIFRLFAIIPCILLFTPIISAQYKYSIQLIMPSQFENDTINLDINNTLENKSFTQVIKNGIAIFAGTMETKYSSAYIYMSKNSVPIDTSFYFSTMPVKLICQENDVSTNPFLKSVFVNIYFQDIIKRMQDTVSIEENTFKNAYSNFRESFNSNKDSLKNIFLRTRTMYQNKLLNFIYNNKSSYFSLSYFNSYFVNRADYSNSDSLLRFFYSTFPKKILNSKEGKFIEKILVSKKQITEGAFAPSFNSTNFYGNKKYFNPKDSTINYTLLQFWASWCAPCIREIPAIKNIKNKFFEQDLQVISVSIDIDSNKWKSAVNKYKLDWENFNDLDIQKKYGITSVPVIYLISPEGIIIYSSEQSRDNELLEKLNSLLEKLLL
ncbi:MAG: TlpA family protein disulfide reductase [Ferruginibacter sp.]|nr:TlpA family protein disulfide reductase [Ferruginibacter sp.]